MDVIQTTRICAVDLEEQGKFSVAESLCLAIIKIISKDNKNNNLSFTERKAIREMQQSKSIGIYQFNNF